MECTQNMGYKQTMGCAIEGHTVRASVLALQLVGVGEY